jgi:hypothetical protein
MKEGLVSTIDIRGQYTSIPAIYASWFAIIVTFQGDFVKSKIGQDFL